MSTRPATFISDEMIYLLESISLKKATFFELSCVQYPWEVTLKTMAVIREQLTNCEMKLRTQYPFRTFVCMASGDAVYWLDEANLDPLREKMRQTIQVLNEKGPMPVWKCTTAEMLSSHLRNIKRLILAVVHDSVLLHNLKYYLGDRYKIVYREFHQAERNVLQLLHSLREHGSKIAYAMNQDLIFLERCKITQTMIEQGETTQEELGYSPDQLNQAIDTLNDRCLKLLPGAIFLFRAIHNYSMNALRDGESSQLIRASRWEILFSLMDEIPKESQSLFQLMTLERSGMTVFVNSREHELGSSPTGKEALQKAQEAIKAVEPAGEPFDVNEKEEDNEEFVEELSPLPSKRVSRMVTLGRRALV